MPGVGALVEEPILPCWNKKKKTRKGYIFYNPKAPRGLKIGYVFLVTTMVQYLTFQNADNTPLVTHMLMYLLRLHSLVALKLHNTHLRICITP